MSCVSRWPCERHFHSSLSQWNSKLGRKNWVIEFNGVQIKVKIVWNNDIDIDAYQLFYRINSCRHFYMILFWHIQPTPCTMHACLTICKIANACKFIHALSFKSLGHSPLSPASLSLSCVICFNHLTKWPLILNEFKQILAQTHSIDTSFAL